MEQLAHWSAFLLLATTALLPICPAGAGGAKARAPARVRIERRSFSWEASLDRATGVASSLERSTSDVLGVGGGGENGTPPSTAASDRRADREAEEEGSGGGVRPGDTFAGYPAFLGRASVALGLRRTTPTAAGGRAVRAPLLPRTALLTFGAPRQARPAKEAVCRVEIPIVGGLMARTAPPPQREDDCGCLRFSWFRSEGRPGKEEVVLVTEVAGRYRPSLAGGALPIPPWRSFLYCRTQRMVHAYVMWRYHGYVMKEYRRKMMSEIEARD